MKYDTNFKSVNDRVSPQEWPARVELSACCRLVGQHGMTDDAMAARTERVEWPAMLRLFDAEQKSSGHPPYRH
jgi:hypothetical protein